MADVIEKKYVDLAGLGHYDEKIKKVIADADAKVASDAEGMYEKQGVAATKVQELADGAVSICVTEIRRL